MKFVDFLEVCHKDCVLNVVVILNHLKFTSRYSAQYFSDTLADDLDGKHILLNAIVDTVHTSNGELFVYVS